jgi:hypothetical protein
METAAHRNAPPKRREQIFGDRIGTAPRELLSAPAVRRALDVKETT